jgi:fido (protein-threonine AMPylation protein)
VEYNNISYVGKLKALQGVLSMSTKLSKALGVSRTSLVNWLDKPDSISADNRFNIDVLYCKHFVVPEWDTQRQSFEPVLLPDNMLNNHKVFVLFLRRLSYGTIEIETGMRKDEFDKAIDAKKLPKNMTVEIFHEAFNTFMTLQKLWQEIIERGDAFKVSEDNIKVLHNGFMRGVHQDAGFYSQKRRVMGQLEGFETTWSEDIPEEMNRWVYKYKNAEKVEDLAESHAHFMAIHPFGDGNGRVGRALLMAQCLNARLMPPVFNAANRAMYYASMEYAMVHGRHAPLARLIYEASQS